MPKGHVTVPSTDSLSRRVDAYRARFFREKRSRVAKGRAYALLAHIGLCAVEREKSLTPGIAPEDVVATLFDEPGQLLGEPETAAAELASDAAGEQQPAGQSCDSTSDTNGTFVRGGPVPHTPCFHGSDGCVVELPLTWCAECLDDEAERRRGEAAAGQRGEDNEP